MTFKEIEKILLNNGWKNIGARGSHYQYEDPIKTGKVTVPHYKGT
jgi:predicted RNA binding protein YcfA (HicA-like mRNA interferase family)